MIKNRLIQEYNHVNAQIKQVKKQLELLPPGTLKCNKNGNYSKWYCTNKGKNTYIPKKEKEYAQELAAKGYYTFQLQELKKDLEILSQYMQYIEKSNEDKKKMLHYYSKDELLKGYLERHPDAVQTWVNEKYTQNPFHPENLVHITNFGLRVRSKSEVIIANTLFQYKIPFRYESGITLNQITFFPDFTILDPHTMKEVYWEHFGMMNDPVYRDNAFNKLKIYGNNNIIPSINLITTYETNSFPINSYQIEQIIQEKFL